MQPSMRKRILVLGAGFGGLELSTMLSEAFGVGVDVTLIDKNDSFYFGFSKLDVMFGHAQPKAASFPTTCSWACRPSVPRSCSRIAA